MDARALIDRLEVTGRIVLAMLEGVSPDEARHKPTGGAWSILEILCHLRDEEVEDFRRRLEHVLTKPADESWPSIDPTGWAVTRKYQEQDFGAARQRYAAERQASLRWLRGLPADTDWTRAYRHPRFGPLAAGDLLASWVAHDLLHVRQITKRRHERTADLAKPFTVAYAGEWTA